LLLLPPLLLLLHLEVLVVAGLMVVTRVVMVVVHQESHTLLFTFLHFYACCIFLTSKKSPSNTGAHPTCCIQSTIYVIYIRAFIFLAFMTFLYFLNHLKSSPLFWHRHRAFLTCYFDPFFSFFHLHNRKKVNCEITDVAVNVVTPK
jgi:hypothetical protein